MLDSLKVGDILYSASSKDDVIIYSSIRIDKVNSCEPGARFSVFWGDESVSHSCCGQIVKDFSLTKELAKARFLNYLYYKLTKGLDKELEDKKKEVEAEKALLKTFLSEEGVKFFPSVVTGHFR